MNEWAALTTLRGEAPGDWSVCVVDSDGQQRYDYQAATVRSAAPRR